MEQQRTVRSVWPRILTYFLIAMLLLTVVSRAADSIMLPVVKCARPLPGALTHRVVLDGAIEAREQLPVMVLPNIIIAKVSVRLGQSVAAGDALLKYNTEALEAALSEAELALKQLLMEREKAAGSISDAPDESGVKIVELALARAEEDLRVETDEQDRAVRLAEAELTEAEAALERAQKVGDAAFNEAYATHLKKVVEAYEAAEQELYKVRVELDWAKNGMTDKAKKKYNELQAAVNKAVERNRDAQLALVDAQLAVHMAGGEELLALDEAQQAADAAAMALDKAQIKRDRIPGARDYTAKRMELELVQIKHDNAKQQLSDAERRTDSVVREIERECEAKLASVETAEVTLANKQSALANAMLAQDAALRLKRRLLEDAESALTEKRRELKELILDVKYKDEAIAEKEKEADGLRRAVAADGTVASPIDGTVSKLIVEPGGTVSGAALRLSPASSGLVVRAKATDEQAKRLAPGMEARFQRYGDAHASYDAAVLKGLSPAADGYEASFDLPDGAGSIGQAVSITVTQNTDTYNMRVPVGAIASSNGVQGVYRIKKGQGVLGDMEYAEFVALRVIETDAQFAAVEAMLSDKDQVIVSMSKPLSAGDRVRSAS